MSKIIEGLKIISVLSLVIFGLSALETIISFGQLI